MNSPHHKIIATKSLIASLMLLCVLSCSAEEHIRFFRRSAGMVSIAYTLCSNQPTYLPKFANLNFLEDTTPSATLKNVILRF